MVRRHKGRSLGQVKAAAKVIALALIPLLLALSIVPGVAVAQPVTFPDPNLEAAIREALNKPTGDITAEELATLTGLDASNRGIADLTGIEYCVNLTWLKLWGNQISDTSPLASLTNLTYLGLLANQISDISPLASLTNLTWLGLWENQISDTSPLASLTDLTYLGLSENQISDTSPLASLINLTWLGIDRNQISDVSPLSSLTNLAELRLHDNQISDISALVQNPGLADGDEVWLENNNLDLWERSEDLENTRTLEARGVVVHHDPILVFFPDPNLEAAIREALNKPTGDIQRGS